MMNKATEITALVINLETATARWQLQTQQLSHLGIRHQRLEATSVDDLTEDEYEKWAHDWQRKLRRTEVACFLSHYRAWQQVLSSQQTFLILEDDALLSSALPNMLQALSHDVHLQYDHLTFETRGRKKLISQHSVYAKDDVALHRLYLDKTGAAAYLLTATGAQKLVDAVAKKGAGLADALLCDTQSLYKLQTVPALAIQMDMASHYEMPELEMSAVAKSNISTSIHTKPSSDTLPLSVKLSFKTKRLAAQLDKGLVLAKYSSKSYSQKIKIIKSDFNYLNTVVKY